MQPNRWSQSSGGRATALALAALLVAAAFTAPAAAIPRMVFQNASVSETTALVGENVTVTATVENIGEDGGGYTLSYTRNGTEFSSERVEVPAETRRQFTESLSFDSPGTYLIRVNGNRAGTVTVERAVARVDSESPDQRTVSVLARSVPAAETTTIDLPPATNRSFAVEQWSVRTAGSNYDQVLTESRNRSATGVVLPSPEQSSLVGVVRVDSNVSVEEATMRVAVTDAGLSQAGIEQDEVTVFQHNGSRWEPLETTVVEQRTQGAVYEATGTTDTEYAIGSIDASVSLVETSIRTESTPNGQRLVLDGELRNDGSVDGEYVGTLSVNGETVNTTTVTVPAAGERTVTLTSDVTDAGTYELALSGTNAGSVVITEGQVAAGTSDGTAGGGDQTDEAGTDSGGIELPDAVPATLFGVDTLYVGAGLGIVLGILIGVLVMARRGGSGGSGGGNTGGFEL